MIANRLLLPCNSLLRGFRQLRAELFRLLERVLDAHAEHCENNVAIWSTDTMSWVGGIISMVEGTRISLDDILDASAYERKFPPCLRLAGGDFQPSPTSL